jgi:alpha-glucoside transport system substrate-binding protein
MALVLAACSGGEAPAEEPVAEEPAAAEESAAAEEPAAEGEMPFAGKTVSVFGAFVDEDASRFQAAMKPFEERTGITVEYEGSGDFETLVLVRTEGGDPPDVAAFPQPGILQGFVRKGNTIDLNTVLDADHLSKQYAKSWLDMATMEGQMAGVWYRANVKSLVWYPVPEFEEAGYAIPETWDELIALSDQMVADGNVPWCIGIESSGATGWVATDWIEDILLRTAPPEKYDQWTTGQLPFNSPEVKRAAEIMGEIWFNPDYVLGGTTSILTVPFGDAPTPMFDDPPSCWMHRQANFIPAFFPEGVEIGQDVNYFYLPGIDEAYGKPLLGAGDIYAMFNDRPEVRAFMEYIITGESTKAWVEAGGFVSPHNDSSLDWYPTDADRGYAEILLAADTFRFDGSDLMPGAVGAGSFWSGMVDYVSGVDLDTVLADIDATWPAEGGGVVSAGEGLSEEVGQAAAPIEFESYPGTTVTIFGAGVGEQAITFNKSFEPFEEMTGINVEYEGSGDFETLTLVRAEGGDAPDLAAFPQPGLMADIARRGFLVDLHTFLDEDYMKQQYSQSWLDLATVDGQMAGVWHNADLKSIVWYPKAKFEGAGYEIPQTWDELIALSDQIVADGGVPWCIGIESSGATGWVATDWMEDIMLRTTSPENYDKWVAGELKFNSPEVKRAAEIMGEIWFNPDYVLGGTTSILTTPFGDAATPMFDDPPTCWLHRQATFIPSFFPEGNVLGVDYNYFYLPPIDPAYGKPVLGSGGVISMFNDRPEVREVVKWLTTGASTRVEVESGLIIAPQSDASLDWYPTPAQRGYAEIVQNADTFRFDGSDLMPGAVGAGSFWTGMVDYVSGEDLDSVMDTIDASWPQE